MLPRTSRFQSRPAVSAGHTSCWITERSGLPQKGTDRQVSDNTCKDKTIYSQRVVDTETYMGDGEWATGGGESACDQCTPAARSAQIAQSTSCQHNKITGGAEKAPWTVTPPFSSPEEERLHCLCPVPALRCYVNRTKALRKSNKLLVSRAYSHSSKSISHQCLSHRVVEVIIVGYNSLGLSPPEGLRALSTRRFGHLVGIV